MPALHGGKFSNYALQQHCKSWHKVFAHVDNHHNGPYFEGLTKKTRDVSHCGLAIYIKKYHVKAKEELWKLMQKYNLSPCKNTIFQKASFKIL
jgi:hypothetical protein